MHVAETDKQFTRRFWFSHLTTKLFRRLISRRFTTNFHPET